MLPLLHRRTDVQCKARYGRRVGKLLVLGCWCGWMAATFGLHVRVRFETRHLPYGRYIAIPIP